MGLDAGRAVEGAWRGAGAVHDCFLRHGLRKGDVGGPAGNHVGIELVRHRDGASHLAQLTPGAGRLVDEAGILPDRRVEVTVEVVPDLFDLGAGHDRDVRMVDGRGHLRGRDAAGAVESGEDLAQKDHLPADGSLLFDYEHLVAHVPHLEGGLHAPDPAADHQDVVVHGHGFWAGPSSVSIWLNSRMYLTKGSAQTEQRAAIFRRSGA